MPEHTPGQTVGPFFHYALPYDRGPELVPAAAVALGSASGRAVRLHGVVRDGDGAPVPDALIEIRQADPAGRVPVVEGSLRRDGTVFTGWGRAATDPAGRYAFTTLEPGATRAGGAAFFAVTVFARGLLDRLFTRAYLPEDAAALARDPLLAGLDPQARRTLLVERVDDGSLRFDVHLQGARETVFLTFPGHAP